MNPDINRQIYSARVLNASLEKVYEAFANPNHLMKWWGPEGFSNTFHEFDLRPGGKWILTMHGPEKGNYENSSIFQLVEPLRKISWKRISKPIFNMEIEFVKLSHSKTQISFRMIFDNVKECEKIKSIAGPKNEENFDRLERELPKVNI